jgi:hypothetical protein
VHSEYRIAASLYSCGTRVAPKDNDRCLEFFNAHSQGRVNRAGNRLKGDMPSGRSYDRSGAWTADHLLPITKKRSSKAQVCRALLNSAIIPVERAAIRRLMSLKAEAHIAWCGKITAKESRVYRKENSI